MSNYSWFNTANGGQITPTVGTPGTGEVQFSYSAWATNIQLSMPFGVTATGYQIAGYYFWWDGTDSVSLYDMCLWQFNGTTWSVVANSDVAGSNSLTSGWNYLELGTPINLDLGTLYGIVTDQTGGFFNDSLSTAATQMAL